MFHDCEIQGALDGLGLRLGAQGFFSALDFHSVQLEVLVDAFIRRRHAELLF
jgi:hypothetical protein